MWSRFIKVTVMSAAAMLLVSSISLTDADTIYKYTDEDGIVRYTNIPDSLPPQSDYTETSELTSSPPVPTNDKDTATPPEVEAPSAEESTAIKLKKVTDSTFLHQGLGWLPDSKEAEAMIKELDQIIEEVRIRIKLKKNPWYGDVQAMFVDIGFIINGKSTIENIGGRIYGTGYEFRNHDLIDDVCRKAYIYAAVGEALDMPIYLVRSPFHVFVRYQMDSTRYVNWETTSMRSLPNSVYAAEDKISPAAIENGTYLRNLSYQEALGAVCNTVGLLYCKQGNNGQAYSIFTRGIRYYAKNPLLHFNRGLILYNSRKFEAAREDFENAVRLNPKYDGAREMLARLKS